MKREKFTAKLLRMLEVIDAGRLPTRGVAVYVFRSYARGALDPYDVNLIVVYGGGTGAAGLATGAGAGAGTGCAMNPESKW